MSATATAKRFEVQIQDVSPETVFAEYFQVYERWVEFKDSGNKVVFAIPEHRVLSIRKINPPEEQ